MLRAARAELAAVGVKQAPAVVVADAGYWNVPQIERVITEGSEVLVSPVSAATGTATALEEPRKPRAKRMDAGTLP